MKIATVFASLFVSLVVCYVSVNGVALSNINYRDTAKNTIGEDDRRGVPQSDGEHIKTKNDKFRRNAGDKQRYLQAASSSYDVPQSTGYSSDNNNVPSKPDYFPSATGLGPLNFSPYSSEDHHNLPQPLQHATGLGTSAYGGSGHGGDLGLGGHTYHYGGPSYGGPKYPNYGPMKYEHGGLFGGHNNAHLKGLWLPLAGIALLGAAAALTTNPVLLQLGVVNGKRKRRSVYQSVKRDLDKYGSIGKYVRDS